jgi:hypothetical protein
MSEKTVNLTPDSSAQGLRDELEQAANDRGRRFRPFVGAIYEYAVNNKAIYSDALSRARSKPGEHIGAVVSESAGKALDQWAKDKTTSRGKLCCYILETTMEKNLLGKIFPNGGDQEP